MTNNGLSQLCLRQPIMSDHAFYFETFLNLAYLGRYRVKYVEQHLNNNDYYHKL